MTRNPGSPCKFRPRKTGARHKIFGLPWSRFQQRAYEIFLETPAALSGSEVEDWLRAETRNSAQSPATIRNDANLPRSPKSKSRLIEVKYFRAVP